MRHLLIFLGATVVAVTRGVEAHCSHIHITSLQAGPPPPDFLFSVSLCPCSSRAQFARLRRRGSHSKAMEESFGRTQPSSSGQSPDSIFLGYHV